MHMKDNDFYPIRLQAYMAKCGVGSRRACEELIREGHVMVNNKVIQPTAEEVERNPRSRSAKLRIAEKI